MLGLGIRPAILAILSKGGYAAEAYEIGLYYFIIATSYVVFHTDAHIQFYKEQYSNLKSSKIKTTKALRQYVGDKISHIIIFAPLIFLGLTFYLNDSLNAFVFTILLIIERIFDEWMRMFLFKNKYKTWSKWFLMKSSVLAISVGWSVYSQTSIITNIGIGLTLLTIFLIFNKENTIIYRHLKFAWNSLSGALKAYREAYIKKYFINQVAAILAINVIQIDKWYVGSVFKNNIFVEIVLISQICSIFAIFVDNFIISINRARFIDINNKINQLMKWKILSWSGFIYWLIGSIFFVFFSNVIGIFNLGSEVKVMIILGFMIFGFTAPLTEFFYWRYPRKQAAYIDGIFMVGTMLLMIIVQTQDNLFIIYSIVASMLMLRFIMYYYKCVKY